MEGGGVAQTTYSERVLVRCCDGFDCCLDQGGCVSGGEDVLVEGVFQFRRGEAD